MLGNIIALIASVGAIINLLIPIAVGAAILVFFWGLIKYINSSGKGHTEGKNIMIAGIVSIFIMLSLYGIIRFAGVALGINQNGNGTAPLAPSIPRQN